MVSRLILVVALALALPGAAVAANEVFTVRNVAVDATAEGSAQAREIAIAQGQRVAFRRLMQRLTRRQDWTYLPDVPADQLSNLLLGFQVTEERSSATRYMGHVTYNFKPAPIRNLLRQSGIAFSEARAKPALLIAVFDSGGQTQLWEDANPWRAAWSKRDLGDELVPILLPLNDLEDAGLISAAVTRSADWNAVSAIAQKYGLERVIIATASAGSSGLAVRLHQVSAYQDSNLQFLVPAGDDVSSQLDRAVDGALSRLYEEWKTATIVSFGQENSLLASVTFGSLQEWLTLRKRLGEAPTVTAVDVLALSTQGAEVRLRYAGTTEQLRITLEQLSLRFSNQGSGWRITLAGASPSGIAPASPSFGGRSMIPSSGTTPSTPQSSTAPIEGTVDPSLVTTVPAGGQ